MPWDGLKGEHSGVGGLGTAGEGDLGQQVVLGVFCSSDLDIFGDVALLLRNRYEESKSQVHVPFPGQPKVYSHPPYLWIFVLQFRFLSATPVQNIK